MVDRRDYIGVEVEEPVEGQQTLEKNEPSASGVAFNLANSLIGGGISIVALPLACRKTGLLLWPILSVFLMLVSCYTGDLMVCCSVAIKENSFASILGHIFGFWAARVMDVVIVVNNISCCVTFLQTFEAVMAPLTVIPSIVWPISGAAFALLFLLLSKNINSLVPLSQFAILEVLLFAGLVVSCLPELPEKLPQAKLALWPPSSRDFLGGLSMTVWSMCFQYNVMPVAEEVCTRDMRKRWLLALSLGTGIPLMFYLFFGILGYLVHPNTEGDILVDFSRFLTGRVLAVLMAVGLIASFPLMEWEAAHSLVRFFSECCPSIAGSVAPSEGNGAVAAGFADPKLEMGDDIGGKDSTNSIKESMRISEIAAHCLGTAISAFLAICWKDVGRVIELVGALIAVPLMLVIPPLIFTNLNIESEGCCLYSRWCAGVVLIGGLVLTATCTYNWFAE